MRARIRLFHNICTMVKERNETSRTKYRRNYYQPVLSWLTKLFIDESARWWQDFSGKYQYNHLCKRENILRNICCKWTMTDIFDFASFQDRQEKFCRLAIYGMIDSSRNTIFSWLKTPNGRVILKTVVTQESITRSVYLTHDYVLGLWVNRFAWINWMPRDSMYLMSL